MDITPLLPKGRQVIGGYGGGGFKINNDRIEGSLLVFPDHHVAWDGNITLESLQPVLNEPGIELLLIGTGSSMKPLDASIHQVLKAKGISAEAMDTGAACRTFNILISEERRVTAALIAV